MTSDAMWQNMPAILGAIFAGVAMLVSLFNGKKINTASKAVDEKIEASTAEHKSQIDEMQEAAKARQKATLLAIDDKHRDFVKVLGDSGLFDKDLIAKQISDFAKLDK